MVAQQAERNPKGLEENHKPIMDWTARPAADRRAALFKNGWTSPYLNKGEQGFHEMRIR